jgi:hypothetical protein
MSTINDHRDSPARQELVPIFVSLELSRVKWLGDLDLSRQQQDVEDLCGGRRRGGAAGAAGADQNPGRAVAALGGQGHRRSGSRTGRILGSPASGGPGPGKPCCRFQKTFSVASLMFQGLPNLTGASVFERSLQ